MNVNAGNEKFVDVLGNELKVGDMVCAARQEFGDLKLDYGQIAKLSFGVSGICNHTSKATIDWSQSPLKTTTEKWTGDGFVDVPRKKSTIWTRLCVKIK